MDLEVIISSDDELRIVVSSESEQEFSIINFSVVSIEFQGLIGTGKSLIEVVLCYIVDASFSANDVKSGLVFVERKTLG